MPKTRVKKHKRKTKKGTTIVKSHLRNVKTTHKLSNDDIKLDKEKIEEYLVDTLKIMYNEYDDLTDFDESEIIEELIHYHPEIDIFEYYEDLSVVIKPKLKELENKGIIEKQINDEYTITSKINDNG